jgi:hypothetical protein
MFFAAGALALAPPAYRDRLDALTGALADAQRTDGGWPNTSLFHALDMLLSVSTAAQARKMLRRAAPLLCRMQQPGGAFDAGETEERALVAVRVLRTAAE